MVANYSAVLFDLDGTLLDTLTDIANSANAVLADHGFPTHPVASYRTFVGDAVAMLFRRALPADTVQPDRIAQCIEQFRVAYESNWNVHTRPYPQVRELLGALETRQIKMAVLSNKPDVFTQRCVAEFLPGIRWEVVVGQRDTVPRKPDPTAAREIAATLKVRPDRFLFVGDTGVDMRTARAAGMRPIGVLWGFRPRHELVENGAETLLERPFDLLEI
jgi:phosphoglycolate phosphatase